MPPAADRETLARRIADLALLKGDFTLRSGRRSSYYLDKYLFSTRPDVLADIGKLFAERIRTVAQQHGSRGEDAGGGGGASGGGVERLAGAELGGIPLVTVASIETGLPCLFIRNAKKDYGTARQMEGKLEPGDRVIFVEDVATTGGQALEAVAILRAAGATVLAVIATIDRQEGARENIEAAGVRFESLFTKQDLGITETRP
jgi:orotate phosphoribosyltransferase